MSKVFEETNKEDVMSRLVNDYLDDKKKRRRRRFIYRAVAVVLVLMAIYMSGFEGIDKNKPHVGVINIKNAIFPNSKSSASRVIKAIASAYESKGLKALIFKINSPGGTPVQAGYIFDEIMYYRKKFPNVKVYAICEDICTSGAYYVSAAADEIYAAPSSMVGSIGVLYNGFGFVDAMEKIGITRRLITAGKNKGFLDPFSEVKPEDTDKLKHMLANIHSQFISSVMKGRGKRLNVSKETFSGLFWSGQEALTMGLIDGLASPFQLMRDKKLPNHTVNYTSYGSLFDRAGSLFDSKPLGLRSLMLNQLM